MLWYWCWRSKIGRGALVNRRSRSSNWPWCPCNGAMCSSKYAAVMPVSSSMSNCCSASLSHNKNDNNNNNHKNNSSYANSRRHDWRGCRSGGRGACSWLGCCRSGRPGCSILATNISRCMRCRPTLLFFVIFDMCVITNSCIVTPAP